MAVDGNIAPQTSYRKKAMPEYFNDSPISLPDEDRFGIDPFARVLASSISEIKSPVGATIALNGPWGSGKSSAVNLIRHHLKPATEDNLVIVDFKCWWFRGEEALTLAFLQTLNSALQRGLGERAKILLGKIGKNLLQAGPVSSPHAKNPFHFNAKINLSSPSQSALYS